MIYTPDSYPRIKMVFLNGKPTEACFYADTKRGIAKVYRMPLRLDKHRKRPLAKTLHGVVTVEY